MPQLTLRDLFAVLTIVAVLVGWWVDHRRHSAAEATIAAENKGLRSSVLFLKDELEKQNGYTVTLSEGGVHILDFHLRRPLLKTIDQASPSN
jgi:hypothetical protein